jgi:hypothetical protein
MRTSTKIASVLVTAFAIGAVPSAHAEDDNVYDGKSYPGSMCQPVGNTQAYARPSVFYVNTAGDGANVVCPIIQESWISRAGLSYGRMQVGNFNGGSISCTQTAYDAVGNFVSSRSASTTGAGTQTLYFFQNGTYLPTTAWEGFITIQCSLGQGDRVISYQVQEKA